MRRIPSGFHKTWKFFDQVSCCQRPVVRIFFTAGLSDTNDFAKCYRWFLNLYLVICSNMFCINFIRICMKLTFWNLKQIKAPRTTKEKGRGPQNTYHCSVPLLVCSFRTLKCTRSLRNVLVIGLRAEQHRYRGSSSISAETLFFFFFPPASLPNQRPTHLSTHWIPRVKRPGFLPLVSHVCLLRGA